jgi:hypothetical protein
VRVYARCAFTTCGSVAVARHGMDIVAVSATTRAQLADRDTEQLLAREGARRPHRLARQRAQCVIDSLYVIGVWSPAMIFIESAVFTR